MLRQQRVKLVAELRHTLAQQRGVERHVDARHQHERRLAAVFGDAAGGIGLQRLQTGDGAGHGVLLSGKVVVDDLQELAGSLRNGFDVFAHAVVAHAELVRTKRAHTVVGTALLVTRDEVVHGGATVEHELKHGFQRNHAGEGAQRVVFAQRVAREVGGPDVRAGFTQTSGLGERHGGERHLRELGQVEQAFRMTVGHAVGGQFLRIITHDGEDGEAELLAGHLVGALPHLACGRGLGTLVEHHALLLDALARVDEGGLRRTHDGGATGHDIAVDAAGHFQHHAGMRHAADAFDGDLHLVVELHHAVHVVRPACDLVMRALLVERLHRVLGGGGQPHAVHERRGETGDGGTAMGGVNRVEIAGSTGEGGHLMRSDDLHTTQQTARSAFDFGFDSTIVGRFRRQRVGVRAAADGETLGFVGKQRTVLSGVRDVDGHHTAGGGFEVVVGPAGELDALAGVLQQLVLAHLEFDEVVEMHGVEQAFDDREAVDVHGAEGRVDGGPSRSDERVRGDAGRHEVARQRAAGGGLMVETEVGGQRVAGVRLAEREGGLVGHFLDLRHGGELVAGDGGVADARGVGEHAVDVLRQTVAVHDREQAGFVAVDVQRNDDVAYGVLGGAAVRIVVPEGVEMDVEVVLFDAAFNGHLADFIVGVAVGGAVRRVGHEVADPGDVRGFADEFLGGDGRAQLGEGGLVGARRFGGHALDHGGFKAAEDVGHRLVHGGDAGHGDRAGDDAHGIGGIAGVLGLPQLVLAPPTQQVVVDDRHERHRLRILAYEHREPCLVHRGDGQLAGLRVGFGKLGDRGVRIGFDVGAGSEQRCEFAAFLRGDAGFDALQQVQEAIGVGFVHPREGEVGETLGPLKVGHGLQIAEIRLGGGVQRRDDLVATAFQLLRVLHDAHQQAAAAGGGVLQLVDVGVQVAQTGGDAALGLAGRHPLLTQRGERIIVVALGRNARSADEHLLDFRVGVRFLGGHDGGADEHAVHRHERTAVFGGPFAGDVVGAAFRRADAAADHEHEVGLLAHFGVGAQQQIVKRFPRVVAACGTAFDLDEHLGWRDGLGDAHHLADLVDGARLEAHVREAVGVEVVDEFHGLVEFRNACGDDDAVDRGAAGTLLRHDALGAELQVPQVAVHEHGVEFDGAAFLEFLLELGHVTVEHAGGDLAAACELGPVAGVGGSRHDLRLHGGRGHAGQQHRSLAGKFGERGAHLVSGGRVDDARRETRPVLGAFRQGLERGERAAIGHGGGFHHADAGALGHGGEQFADGVARTEVQHPQGARIGGLHQGAHAGGPIHMVEQHFGGELTGMVGVDAAGLGPCDGLGDGIGHQRAVERQGHVEIFERRVEHAAATHLLLAQLGLTLVFLGDLHAECGQVLRIAGQHVMRGGIGDGHGDRATCAVDAFDQRVHLGAGDVLDGQHRGRLAVACGETELACLTGAGDADQRCDRKNLVDLGCGCVDGTGFADRLHHMHGKHALGVAEHRDRLGLGRIVAECGGVEQRAQLGQRDAGNAGGSRGCGAQTCRVRFEAEQVDRASGGGEQLGGHRVQQRLRSGRMGVQGLVERRIGTLVGERHRPRGGLAGEGERVGLAVQSIKKKGVHNLPYLFQNFLRLLWLLTLVASRCVRHSGWLPWCLLVRRTRFLLASRRSDSMMVSRVCSGSIMASISPISSERFALTVVRS